MTFEEFASALDFRVIRAHDPMTGWRRRVPGVLRRLGIAPEIFMTKLPNDGPALRARLRPLLALPRMSTFAVAALINRAVGAMPAGQAFVNVGVWHGFTLLAGMAGHADRVCIGIDNFSQFGGPREAFLERFRAAAAPPHAFHDLDYAAYLHDVHRGPIGVYIYDGDHAYEHQLRGLTLAEPFFAPGCLIFVDDTNTDDPARATRDFMAARPGAYDLIFDRRTAGNGHPTLWNGLMILRKRGV